MQHINYGIDLQLGSILKDDLDPSIYIIKIPSLGINWVGLLYLFLGILELARCWNFSHYKILK